MMHCPDTFLPAPIHIEQTDSTINYLKAYCQEHEAEEFTTVVADYQTAGRGQRGNSWEAEKGKNLLFSFVCFPRFLQARRQFLLSQIVSLSIKETLDAYTEEIFIKWPNDIYWKEKKICGILIENDLTGKDISQSIAGIGINVNQKTFSSPAPNPISLWQITGKEHSPEQLLKEVMQRLKSYYDLLKRDECGIIAQRYDQSLFRRHGLHPYRDAQGNFSAEIVRIEEDGRLILKTEKGEERGYMFKEVEYLQKQ